MKKKSVFRICLDVGMLFLFVLLYQYRLLGGAFHEIGGIVLFFIALLHFIVNGKRYTALFKARQHRKKSILRAVVDVLLIVDMAVMIVSGLCISKVILTNFTLPGASWKMIHLFTAGLALIFGGIHLGFHFEPLFRKTEQPKTVAASHVVGIIVAAALVLFGGYNAVVSLPKMLSAPFTSSKMEHGNFNGSAPYQNGNFGKFRRNNWQNGSNLSQQSGNHSDQQRMLPQNGASSQNPPGGGRQNNQGRQRPSFGQNGQNMPQGGPNGSLGRRGEIAAEIVTYLSIFLAIALLTAFLSSLSENKKKKEPETSEAAALGTEKPDIQTGTVFSEVPAEKAEGEPVSTESAETVEKESDTLLGKEIIPPVLPDDKASKKEKTDGTAL